MKLYHYTKYSLKDKIFRDGLVFTRQKIKEDLGTRIINKIIKEYKPNYFQDYIDRSKCVFFFIERDEDDFGFEVDSKNLDQNRLFVFDYNMVQQLYDLHIDHATIEECKGGEFERLSRRYWESAIPLVDFKQKSQGLWDKEVLYFDKVPAHLLKVIRDESEEFINIIDKASNYFNVRKSGFNRFDVYTDRSRKCNCNYIYSKRLMQVDFDYDIDVQVSRVLKKVIESESVYYQGLIIRFDGVYKINDDGESIGDKWEAYK